MENKGTACVFSLSPIPDGHIVPPSIPEGGVRAHPAFSCVRCPFTNWTRNIKAAGSPTPKMKSFVEPLGGMMVSWWEGDINLLQAPRSLDVDWHLLARHASANS